MRFFTTVIAVTALTAPAVLAAPFSGAAHSNDVRQLQSPEDYHLHRRRDNQLAYVRRDFDYLQKRLPTASDLDSGSDWEPERTGPLRSDWEPERTGPLKVDPREATHGTLWGDRDIPPKSPAGDPAPSNTGASRATAPLDSGRRTQRKEARKQEAQAGPSTSKPVAQSKSGLSKKPKELPRPSEQDKAAYQKQLKQERKDQKAADKAIKKAAKGPSLRTGY
ncbi:hypothetical protein EIP91_000389 [Steccherinum ochraceum]|uniref:Uncharacterized protein n=1 Tax=Steccherinum ochraceum TaxID=92696 RepID=A0A4R0RJZ2_9APHY|nr:hypothetical protein EIP91_000389 [Steccherinum ochraceum]